MKLRLRHNSVRLRLTKGEVSRFADEGVVEETIDLGSGRIVYRLQSAEEEQNVHAAIADGVLTISVPGSLAREWTAGEMIGFQHQQSIGSERELSILVEKDFKCLEPRGAEDDDGFPHPGKC